MTESVIKQLLRIPRLGETGGTSSQATLSRFSEDVRQVQVMLRFWNDIISLQDIVDILGVKIGSFIRFDRHFQKVRQKASQKAILLRELSISSTLIS